MVEMRVRAVRTERGMTLTELAKRTGLSPGLISQVERGHTNPSLETLRRVAEALEVPIFSLFDQEAVDSAAVVTRERRMLVRSPHGGITYTRVSPGVGRLEVLEGTLEPGGVSAPEPWSHPSEECVVVLRGELVVEVDGKEHPLAVGDSCYFDSRRPHRYCNRSTERATFLVTVTPPSY
ncbi:MAG: cupin domain-containing protein [Streptosporangiales bacterium]|nr:cupin domain-containing protein [Streptosporangiales bacterium]